MFTCKSTMDQKYYDLDCYCILQINLFYLRPSNPLKLM